MKRFEHYLYGRFVSSETPLTAQEVEAIVEEGRQAGERLAQVPIRRIVDVLDRVARRWLDPEYVLRQQAARHMPEVVGFHRTMVEKAIDALANSMLSASIQKKLRIELGSRDYLDDWKFNPIFAGYLRALPIGVVLHVSAGNVFVGAADSLMCGLVTKNANILKIASDDPIFPLLFARSVQEADPGGEVANSFALIQFRGGEEDVEAVLKTRTDGIVIWGGEGVVQAYRKGVPQNTRIIPYGPRYSLSVFTQAGLEAFPLEETARAAAMDVIRWEQRACSSPQVFFVETSPGSDMPLRFVMELEKQLAALARELPQARLEVDEQVEILRARELARMEQALDRGRLGASEGDTSWTVIYEPQAREPLAPHGALNRVITIRTFLEFSELAEALKPVTPYLQTVALRCGGGELSSMATALARLGVTRMTRVGEMGIGRAGAPHDGTWQLQDLVRWVDIESDEERFDLGVRLVPKNSLSKWQKLQQLAVYAVAHSPFYLSRLSGLALDAAPDMDRIPLLDKHDIYRETPPVGDGLLTGPLEKAYVFASGGSTGAPKFSFYTYDEFDQVTSILAEIYQVAGITSRDVVGNLFMAGNLWTSFIVANEALEKIGCVTLPIAGNADVELVLRYMQLFKPTGLIGIPSIIIQVAEEVERRGLELQVGTILYGGEHMSPQARALLRRSLGAKVIISAGYASVDAGPIGYQCHEVQGTVHHLLYDYQYLEILDPETLEPVRDDREGEIVVTNMERRLMPMLRFRTGDRGRWIKRECACGRNTPLFELLGRVDDVVRVGSVSVYPDTVADVLAQVAGASQLFQVVAEHDGARDRLTIRTEYAGQSHGTHEYDSVRQDIYENLLTANLELAEALREGWLGSLVVEVLPPGQIPRVRRTGKIKKVVDLRTTAGAQV